MKLSFIAFLIVAFSTQTSFSQKLLIQSPDQKINAALFCQQNSDAGFMIKLLQHNTWLQIN
jgi:hypothetical protein